MRMYTSCVNSWISRRVSLALGAAISMGCAAASDGSSPSERESATVVTAELAPDPSAQPEHAPVFCGAAGQSCCAEEPRCEDGLTCNANGICRRCGNLGQRCCVGGACLGELTCSPSNSCVLPQSCGSPGEPCCSGTFCEAGTRCLAGVCQSSCGPFGCP